MNAKSLTKIGARSEQFNMYMRLDVNIELCLLNVREKFVMVSAPMQAWMELLIVVIHSSNMLGIALYGSLILLDGLWMMLKGNPSNASNFESDQRWFLVTRKARC